MGKTKLNPMEMDEFVDDLFQKRFRGEKYQKYGNNCNNCAKAILKHSLSPENAMGKPERKWKSRYNRLSNLMRRMPKFVQNKFGK
jgi:phage pi2 protein 07